VLVLLCLLLAVVKPGVAGLIWQPTFVLLDIADDGAMVSATPATSGRGAGGSQGEPLATIALDDDLLRAPLIGPAEGDLMGLVVRLDALDNLGHLLAPSCCLTSPVGE
jgi:hypothetical protein